MQSSGFFLDIGIKYGIKCGQECGQNNIKNSQASVPQEKIFLFFDHYLLALITAQQKCRYERTF